MLLLHLLLSITPPLRSPNSMTPPLHPPLLVGFRTCDWWRRGGFVVIAPVPIHQWTWALYSASHLRRGPISPFTNSPRGKKKFFFARIRVSSASLVHFACSYASICGHFGFGLVRRLQLEKEVSAPWIEFFGRKLAVFVQSFDRLGSFVAPKAWEHKSPKPLEKRKPRWKSLRKAQLLQQRQTDR